MTMCNFVYVLTFGQHFVAFWYIIALQGQTGICVTAMCPPMYFSACWCNGYGHRTRVPVGPRFDSQPCLFWITSSYLFNE